MRIATARNYAADMRKAMDDMTDGMATYNAALIAIQLRDKLLQDDPELLEGWLLDQAPHFLKEAIRTRDASTRAHARSQAAPSTFDQDAKKFAAGNAQAMDGWLQATFVADDKDTRKALRDMSKTEVTFAAVTFDSRAKANAMQAAFLKAVAKKIPNGSTVKDVFDNETLGTLWRGLEK